MLQGYPSGAVKFQDEFREAMARVSAVCGSRIGRPRKLTAARCVELVRKARDRLAAPRHDFTKNLSALARHEKIHPRTLHRLLVEADEIDAMVGRHPRARFRRAEFDAQLEDRSIHVALCLDALRRRRDLDE